MTSHRLTWCHNHNYKLKRIITAIIIFHNNSTTTTTRELATSHGDNISTLCYSLFRFDVYAPVERKQRLTDTRTQALSRSMLPPIYASRHLCIYAFSLWFLAASDNRETTALRPSYVTATASSLTHGRRQLNFFYATWPFLTCNRRL